MSHDFQVEIGERSINFNTGYYAKQADGAVIVTSGETMVLATAVASKTVVEGQDFFPLSVEYREKYYASGRFPGGYIKREGRPADHEILTCRITDRPLRPLFPKDFVHEVQIIISVISSDREVMADVLAINAASAALSVSGMPFKGPVGAVRVGRINGQWIINPTLKQIPESDIDLVVAGTEKAVTMIEGLSKNISEDDMLYAVQFAHDNIKKICACQKQMMETCAKAPMQYIPRVSNAQLEQVCRDRYYGEIDALNTIFEKKAREDAFSSVVNKAKSELAAEYPDQLKLVGEIIHDIDRDIVRERILNGKRPDGRAINEIRPIDIKSGMLPRAHGSAVFTRGQTQSLGIVTLGTERDAQKIDTMNGEESRRFMLHYNFPPFSVGECGRFGGTGRRELGHGMLAERALAWTVPDFKEFPYTVRVVSEILESNGSSSMATVCSGSLAMFNAGIPCKAPIAGIAMGLVMDGDRFTVLSDIQGIEDHLGDMDFKVAGTADGITAFQLDIKIEGITPEIMKIALAQAREGRLHILGKMNEALDHPSVELSPYAPRIAKIKIAQDKIGELIGPGGKNIRGICEQTGSEIVVNDEGEVMIYAADLAALKKAEGMVQATVSEVEAGRIYEGTVKRIMEYGAFVEVLPGKEGLLHISKIENRRIQAVTDVLNIGDVIKVKVMSIDKNGRMDLSKKDADAEQE